MSFNNQALTTLAMAGLLAAALTAPLDSRAQTASIEDQLSKSGQGVGRFRGGLYGSLGWGVGSKVKFPVGGGTRPSGFHIEGGAYGLFNPVRDLADIEGGIGVSFLTPSSQTTGSGQVDYKTGFVAATVYAGPVFRLGRSGSSLALGAQLLLGNKVLKDSNDAFIAAYPAKMKSSLGIYGEYQYKGTEDGSKAIYFTRVAASRYDVTFQGAPTSINDQGQGDILMTVSVGIKY